MWTRPSRPRTDEPGQKLTGVSPRNLHRTGRGCSSSRRRDAHEVYPYLYRILHPQTPSKKSRSARRTPCLRVSAHPLPTTPLPHESAPKGVGGWGGGERGPPYALIHQREGPPQGPRFSLILQEIALGPALPLRNDFVNRLS